jgi:hypothetical protein
MANDQDLLTLLDTQVLFNLATIHAYVVSRETTKSIQAYNFDHYLQEAKNQIKTDEKSSRPTKLDKLQRVADLIDSTIDKVKQFNKDQKEKVKSDT